MEKITELNNSSVEKLHAIVKLHITIHIKVIIKKNYPIALPNSGKDSLTLWNVERNTNKPRNQRKGRVKATGNQ